MTLHKEIENKISELEIQYEQGLEMYFGMYRKTAKRQEVGLQNRKLERLIYKLKLILMSMK